MPTVILRSLLGRIATVVVAVISLYPVLVIWLADGYGNGLTALAFAALVDFLVWLLWWRPQAILREDALWVRNEFRSHRIDYAAVRTMRTRWGLLLEVEVKPRRDECNNPECDSAKNSVLAASPAAETAAEDQIRVARVAVSACPRGGLFTAMRRERRQPQAREEYLTASLDSAPPTYHAHLDCDDAGYLLDLYRTARAQHLALAARLRRRRERMQTSRRGNVPALQEEAAPLADAPAVATTLRTRWDFAPVTVGIVLVLAAAATVLFL